jgi:hypothetical protein
MAVLGSSYGIDYPGKLPQTDVLVRYILLLVCRTDDRFPGSCRVTRNRADCRPSVIDPFDENADIIHILIDMQSTSGRRIEVLPDPTSMGQKPQSDFKSAIRVPNVARFEG